MNSTPRLRRSLLYVPGNKETMLAKAAQRGADGLILNLEDAVAESEKSLARETVSRALANTGFGNSEVIVRINPLSTDHGYRDLLAVMPGGPGAILLPKVRSAEEVRFAAWTIERLEGIHGLEPGRTAVMCMIESAAGILAAEDIASSHPRVAALIFGANDFSENVGCATTTDQRPLLYAISRLILAAHNAGVDAIDSPHMQLQNLEGLARAAQIAREMGFDGKSAIHPAQVQVINAVFSPSPEQVEWARRVVQALATDAPEKAGAAVLDGQLVEAPHLARARRILAMAQRVQIKE